MLTTYGTRTRQGFKHGSNLKRGLWQERVHSTLITPFPSLGMANSKLCCNCNKGFLLWFYKFRGWND